MRARFLIITQTHKHSLSYPSFSLSLCRAPENFSPPEGLPKSILATERASVCVCGCVGARAGAYIYLRIYSHIHEPSVSVCVCVSGRAGGAIFVSFYRFTRAGDDGSPRSEWAWCPGGGESVLTRAELVCVCVCVSEAGDENSREGCMRVTSVVHLQCVEYDGVYHTLSR